MYVCYCTVSDDDSPKIVRTLWLEIQLGVFNFSQKYSPACLAITFDITRDNPSIWWCSSLSTQRAGDELVEIKNHETDILGGP